MTTADPTAQGTMERRSTREFECELPVGYIDEDGRVHQTAVLRKMTGHEEALLTDKKLRQNGGLLVSELLLGCIRRLGDRAPVTRKMVTELTSPDRNFLLLQLRKITFGTELEAAYTCSRCGDTTRVLHDLDELPVRRTDGVGAPEIVVKLEDGFEDRDQIYTDFVFRLPSGLDEEKIAAAVKENPSRGTNALLTRCLRAVGDMPSNRRDALGTKIIGDLTMGDRARIEKAFRAEMPGLDLTREIQCANCARKFSASLDLTSFFSLQ